MGRGVPEILRIVIMNNKVVHDLWYAVAAKLLQNEAANV